MKLSSNIFSFIGLLLGSLAFIATLAHLFLGPINPPPPIEDIVAETVSSVKARFLSHCNSEIPQRETVKQGWDADDIVQVTTIIMSICAIIFAQIAFMRREDKRITMVAAALGSETILFHLALFMFGLLAAAILIALIVIALGGSC